MNKRNLTDEEIDNIIDFIESRFRYCNGGAAMFNVMFVGGDAGDNAMIYEGYGKHYEKGFNEIRKLVEDLPGPVKCDSDPKGVLKAVWHADLYPLLPKSLQTQATQSLPYHDKTGFAEGYRNRCVWHEKWDDPRGLDCLVRHYYILKEMAVNGCEDLTPEVMDTIARFVTIKTDGLCGYAMDEAIAGKERERSEKGNASF